jgi:hypothetical protein
VARAHRRDRPVRTAAVGLFSTPYSLRSLFSHNKHGKNGKLAEAGLRSPNQNSGSSSCASRDPLVLFELRGHSRIALTSRTVTRVTFGALQSDPTPRRIRRHEPLPTRLADPASEVFDSRVWSHDLIDFQQSAMRLCPSQLPV